MTSKKTTRRALFSSFMALLLCCSMLVGTTFAWFTDSVTSSNNIIKSGTLDVEMSWSDDNADWEDASTGAIFDYDLWEPGFTQIKYVNIKNAGTLAFKYQLNIVPDVKPVAGAYNLADVIDVYMVDVTNAPAGREDADVIIAGGKGTALSELMADPDGAAYGAMLPAGGNKDLLPADLQTITTVGEATYCIILHMQETAGNEYQNLSVGDGFAVQLLATQLTAEMDSFGPDYDAGAEYETGDADVWDGTVDISWYIENPNATEYSLSSAAQLAGLAALVDNSAAIPADARSGIALPVTFEGKTVKLDADVDLYYEDGNGNPVSFDPIGDESPFSGTFDGQGHTIKNLYQSGWAFGYEWGSYGSIGLFGEVKDATIKNLTISGAESLVEGGDVGGITGSATGNCVFEDIIIENSTFATYNNGNGGIIGWSGSGNYTFKNVTIGSDVVLAGLWGSFDSSIGGVVGQGEPGATYNFENVDIACRLDVYNDCTASYDYYNYRMCGMIIGRLQKTTTIDGTNYPDMSQYNITCNDVTVTYGDWANYHYCEPTPGLNGGRGMRVEPGYAYDGLPADYDHTQCVDNHMNLIPFDQIFGGAQLGVKGLPAYDGVTVSYNN